MTLSVVQASPLELLYDQQYLKAYELAFSPDYATALAKLIPLQMHGSMVRYILTGVFPGSFLIALLRGDLFATLAYADSTNIQVLHQYGDFLYNYAPSSCFGNDEAVQLWSKRGGQLGPDTSPDISEEQNIA